MVQKRAEMALVVFGVYMSIKILRLPPFGLDHKDSMFSSVLKGKRKTDYKPEIKSIKRQKLHSDDDGSYVRYAQRLLREPPP